MAEKRVNIRLATVGGLQVKADFEGIGQAAERGLGKASTAADKANEKMAALASKVKLAMAAAAAAAVAAGAALVRSSLEVIDRQAKLAASLGTTVESVQVLERAAELAGVSLGELEQATEQLTRRLSRAAAGDQGVAAALARLNLSARELLALPLDQRIAAIQDALARYVPAAERAAVAGALFGERAGLAISRIDTRTLRVATQDVRDFGVAVSQADAAKIEAANDAVSRLGQAWRGFANALAVAAAPSIQRAADAIAALLRPAGLLGSAIRGLLDQLGRLASYAATAAVVFGVRWVASVGAAAVAAVRLSKGIEAIKWAVTGLLSRSGLIGLAIIVGGELTYQFLRLIDYVGGLAELFKRIGPLSTEVWARVKRGAAAAAAAVTAFWLDLAALIAEQLPALESILATATQRFVNAFKGAKDAIKVVWGGLKDWFSWLFGLIGYNVLSSIEDIINGLIDRLNTAIGAINSGLQQMGLSAWLTPLRQVNFTPQPPIDPESVRDIAAAASKAFWDAYLKPPENAEQRAEETAKALEAAMKMRQLADKLRARAEKLREGLFAPLKSLEGAGKKAADELEEGAAGVDRYGAALDRALSDEQRKRVEEMARQLEELAQKSGALAPEQGAPLDDKSLDQLLESIERKYQAIRDTSKQLAEDITGPIKDALKSAELTWKSFSDTVVTIARNMVARLIDAAFRPLENVLTNLFTQLVGQLSWRGGLPAAVAAAAGFARGGVFQGGRELHAFAGGGVISRPLLFPLAGGIGLAGEAGPEAILPLRRGPGGRLGVEARGVGTILNVSIDARGADVGAAARLRAAIPELARAIEGVARGEAARGLARA